MTKNNKPGDQPDNISIEPDAFHYEIQSVFEKFDEHKAKILKENKIPYRRIGNKFMMVNVGAEQVFNKLLYESDEMKKIQVEFANLLLKAIDESDTDFDGPYGHYLNINAEKMANLNKTVELLPEFCEGIQEIDITQTIKMASAQGYITCKKLSTEGSKHKAFQTFIDLVNYFNVHYLNIDEDDVFIKLFFIVDGVYENPYEGEFYIDEKGHKVYIIKDDDENY
jgi:hypothetical protein